MSHPLQPRLPEEASNPATSPERLIELSAHPPLRPIVAGNPATPAPLLARLAQDQNVQVRENVASNPNTPWQTLEQVAWEFPHAFLSNPVGPLNLLAHPEQISTQGAFWDALLRAASIPSLWWAWLQSHPTLSTSQGMRLHVQHAGEISHPYGVPQVGDEDTLLILIELLAVAWAQGAALPSLKSSTAALQPEMTGEQFIGEHLRWLVHRVDTLVRTAIAENPLAPREVLRALAQNEDYSLRCRVANNPQTPVEILQTLAQDAHTDVRRAVANNPQTPVEILRSLAQDAEWLVRRDVASHPQTPAEVLRTLALDNQRVREQVARHPQTPGEVLQTLALDADANVRRAVAVKQPPMPGEALRSLAQDEDQRVREWVARHPQTPGEVLQTLIQDTNTRVRIQVAYHPQLPVVDLRSLAQDADESVRRGVALNPQTPGEVLQTLMLDHAWRVRSALAERPQIGEVPLCILAQDHAWQVRKAVALHPQTPGEMLQTLARTPDWHVRAAVAGNRQAPAEVIHTLTQDEHANVRCLAHLIQRGTAQGEESWGGAEWRKHVCGYFLDYERIEEMSIENQLGTVAERTYPQMVKQMLLAALAADWDVSKVQAAFVVEDEKYADEILRDRRKHAHCIMAPFMPPIALEKLAISPRWEVRYLVALHERTRLDTRQRLSQDGNRYVRAMARAKAELQHEPAR